MKKFTKATIALFLIMVMIFQLSMLSAFAFNLGDRNGNYRAQAIAFERMYSTYSDRRNTQMDLYGGSYAASAIRKTSELANLDAGDWDYIFGTAEADGGLYTTEFQNKYAANLVIAATTRQLSAEDSLKYFLERFATIFYSIYYEKQGSTDSFVMTEDAIKAFCDDEDVIAAWFSIINEPTVLDGTDLLNARKVYFGTFCDLLSDALSKLRSVTAGDSSGIVTDADVDSITKSSDDDYINTMLAIADRSILATVQANPAKYNEFIDGIATSDWTTFKLLRSFNRMFERIDIRFHQTNAAGWNQITNSLGITAVAPYVTMKDIKTQMSVPKDFTVSKVVSSTPYEFDISVFGNKAYSGNLLASSVYTKWNDDFTALSSTKVHSDSLNYFTVSIENGKLKLFAKAATPKNSDFWVYIYRDDTGYADDVTSITERDMIHAFKVVITSKGGGGTGGGGDNPPVVVESDHFAYILGYPDNTVRPDGNMSREEVATMICRVLSNGNVNLTDPSASPFIDVKIDRWSSPYIEFVKERNIMIGYENGTFDPSNIVTRAEFVKSILSLSSRLITEQVTFSDIAGHWAEEYIKRAAGMGLIKGYGDGTFKPDSPITRAEVVTITNKVLGRKITKQYIPSAYVTQFTDLDVNFWAYEDVIEATNAHKYSGQKSADGSEIWLRVGENNLEHERLPE